MSERAVRGGAVEGNAVVATRAMPDEPALVTVVVCTAGERPIPLARCLASLARLEDDAFEVVLVDNARVASVVTAALADGHAGVCYVHEPRPGQNAARNRGIAAAKGEVVAFVDDDCEVDSGWLASIRRALDDPTVACATGRVRPAKLDEPTERWFEEVFSFDRGPDARRFARREPGPFLRYPGQLGTGCNMAFRRSVFDLVGGFDEAIEVGTPIGGGGDLDMFARVLDAGVVAVYEPSALVFHHHRDNDAALRRQFRAYGTAFGALTVKFAVNRPGLRVAVAAHYADYTYRRARRLAACLTGRNAFPARLVADELIGMLTGPFRYALAARRRGVRRR